MSADVKKRWVLVVDRDTHGWIKETADKLETSGQALFEEMLKQFRSADLTDFKQRIQAAKVAERLARIQAKRAALDAEERELKKK